MCGNTRYRGSHSRYGNCRIIVSNFGEKRTQRIIIRLFSKSVIFRVIFGLRHLLEISKMVNLSKTRKIRAYETEYQ